MYRLEPTSKSLNPILKQFDSIWLDSEDIENIVPAIPSFLKLIENARLDNKLGLLTWEYKWREEIVYNYEECLNWFEKYVAELPLKINEMKKKRIIEEATKKAQK